MSNYHFEIIPISRGRGHSVTRLANYVSGQKLHDIYLHETYYRQRTDIAFMGIFLPARAPSDFDDLQRLCDKIECAEKRYDARTARELIASLPNELALAENIRIVETFIRANFLEYGLCAIAAIHKGQNLTDPTRNNPHTHIILPTRTLDENGFHAKKYRELDKQENVKIWRKQWADVQNIAYERNGLPIRVSHESLEVQGKWDRKPKVHLSRIDWQRMHQENHAHTKALTQSITQQHQHLQQEMIPSLDIE